MRADPDGLLFLVVGDGMFEPDYAALVKQLVSDDATVQSAAKKTLFTLDEDAVAPLLDEFYAGVTDARGTAILDVLARIGGYEALNALRSILFFDLSMMARPAFRTAAAQGLLMNIENLSPDEIEKINHHLNKLE